MSLYKKPLPWMQKKDLYVEIVVAVVLFFVSIIFSFVKKADTHILISKAFRTHGIRACLVCMCSKSFRYLMFLIYTCIYACVFVFVNLETVYFLVKVWFVLPIVFSYLTSGFCIL